MVVECDFLSLCVSGDIYTGLLVFFSARHILITLTISVHECVCVCGSLINWLSNVCECETSTQSQPGVWVKWLPVLFAPSARACLGQRPPALSCSIQY